MEPALISRFELHRAYPPAERLRTKIQQRRSVLRTSQLTAVLATTFFAGAAIHINLVEHPACMGQDGGARSANLG